MTAPDDDALMARVVQGDRSAFATLVARHLTPLHHYLRRLTGSVADAEDLSQEAFLRVWERAARYRPGTVQFSTWLHRVAHNLAVDAARRRRPETVALSEQLEDHTPDPPEQVAAAQTARRLDAALAALPTSQRAALLLCQVQGFSNRDAGAIVGVSVRGLESLLARARRSLRAALLEPASPAAAHQPSESTDHDAA